MNRNMQALKILALVGAALAYAGAVLYGDIMFLQTVDVAFPKSGIFASLSIAGALVTALSALILPIALHWWFAPGLQFVWGIIYWALDIAALALNSMLAFQAAAGGTYDPLIATWRTWSPATPILAVIGWGIAFLLDPAHKLRHAQAELEADQIDTYAMRLRTASKSPEVSDVLMEAAKVTAWEYAQRLNNALPAKSSGRSTTSTIPASTSHETPAPVPPIDTATILAALQAAGMNGASIVNPQPIDGVNTTRRNSHKPRADGAASSPKA